MRPVRVGVMLLQNRPWADMISSWHMAEEHGFDHGWLIDGFGDGAMPEMDLYEAWTSLAGIAASTSRIRLGTLVSTIAIRHPAMLAREAMTVDHISGGRVEVGIGAGASYPGAYTRLGYEPWSRPERIRRYREAVEIIDGLLTKDTLSYGGKYYSVEDAIMRPQPIQKPRPRLTLAAHIPATMRIAAQRADCWSWVGPALSVDRGSAAGPEDALAAGASLSPLEATQEASERIDDYCRSLGRDPATLDRSLLVGFTGEDATGSRDSLQHFIGTYREAGINEFVFYWIDGGFPGFPREAMITDEDQLGMVSEEAARLRSN